MIISIGENLQWTLIYLMLVYKGVGHIEAKKLADEAIK